MTQHIELKVGQKIRVQKNARFIYGSQENPISEWVIKSIDTTSSFVPFITFKGSKVEYAFGKNMSGKYELTNGNRTFDVIEIL